MPKSKYGDAPSKETTFVDRQSELRRVADHVDTLYGEPEYLKVLEVLGLGGMGKTTFLEKVWTNTFESRNPDHLLWVSLEAGGFTTAVNPLLRMRDQLRIECVLFDTALLAYWRAMGQPLQLSQGEKLANSLAFKALELSAGMIYFSLPIGFGIQVYKSLKKATARWEHYTSEEFEEIERLERRPQELLDRLPHYLGLDLRRRADLDDELIAVFYDGYEKLGQVTRREHAPWMREFIATLDRGVHVVSTRESLDWEKPEWGELLDVIPIGPLPIRYAREMILNELGAPSPAAVDGLIKASHRTPFVLETAIASYAKEAKQGQPIKIDEVPSSPDEIFKRFLDHLPETQEELAVAMAAIQIFDEALFERVITALNIPISLPSFKSFKELHFVEKTTSGLHKTHDILTSFVREAASRESIRVAALEAATEDVHARCLGSENVNPYEILPILGSVLTGWASTVAVPTNSIEALGDVALSLYDAGYWNDLWMVGSEDVGKEGTPIAAVSEFLVALTTRRIIDVETARSRFRKLMPNANLLGRHQQSAELESAYVDGLDGDYKKARGEFGRLAAQADPFNPLDRTHRRSRMYQSGMLTMDGYFKRSAQLALETYEAVDPEVTTDWGELVRYSGHAHRFSFMLDEAERRYLLAMDSIEENEAPALLGRLQTNLAETYCWHKPLEALTAADNGTELNHKQNNQIELAKCAAARGIALARGGDFKNARIAVSSSLSVAEEVGYQAGIAFALQASAVVDCLGGLYDVAEATNKELKSVVSTLGTYLHLQVVPFLLLGDDIGLDQVLSSAEWFDANNVITRIAKYLDL